MPDTLSPPRHDHQPEFPTPGIYLGMPDEMYHAIHACSASGLKNLAVSSMDYWANSPLNLEREEKPERGDGKLTPLELGRAYHCYICEGEEEFNKRYCIALDKDEERAHCEFHGRVFVVTTNDIRKAIGDAGGKPRGTAKEPLIEQLLDFVPDAVIWERHLAKYAERNKGKVMISDLLHRRIQIANAMITGDPQLADAFTGGYPEVSVFWYDPTTGVPCKARFDYLKPNHLIDLKSFSNKMRKPVQRAIDSAIAYEKYFMAVGFYLDAIEEAKKIVIESKGRYVGRYAPITRFDTETGEDVIEWAVGVASEEDRKWFWQWAHQPEPQCLWIFQQTGIAPVTRGRIMNTGSTLEVTRIAMRQLMRKWRKCALTYGTDPWLDLEPVRITVDEEINQWAATDFGEIIYEEEE